MPEKLQLRFHSPNDPVHFRWFAFENWMLLMQKFKFSKISEISGFGTFISDGFISTLSSRKRPILVVDSTLDSSDSKVFKAVFDVITAWFPADLSRFFRHCPSIPFIETLEWLFWITVLDWFSPYNDVSRRNGSMSVLFFERYETCGVILKK